MNEWDLQHTLSTKFRSERLQFGSVEFELVCWELMFPSWSVNDKFSKWNETSIDFIFYSENKNLFLCVELKNNLKTKKELLSAYCQVTQRAVKFSEQFSIEKITNARNECFKNAPTKRGGPEKAKKLKIKENSKVGRILIANNFLKNYEALIEEWNKLSYEELLELVNSYTENTELKRYKSLSKIQIINTLHSGLSAFTFGELLCRSYGK